jgi:hypothetical protein
VIDLDDDDEEEEYENEAMDVEEPSQRRKLCHHPAHSEPTTSEHGENNTDHDGDDEELSGNENIDLANLNSLSLKKKIHSEVKSFQFLIISIYYRLSFICFQRPQWRNHQDADTATQQEVDPTGHVSLSDNRNDSEVDMYGSADIPDMGHHEAGTTASEFDGALDLPGDEDKVTEDDKFDNESSVDEPKISKKVSHNLKRYPSDIPS